MKRIRIGKDLYCRLTVLTNGEAVSLEGEQLTLYMVYPDNEKTEVEITEVVDNVLKFHITPEMQKDTGVYGFETWKNVDSGYQTVCDRVRAFELVPLSVMEGGVEDWKLETETVDITTNFSGDFVIVDNLESDRTDAALSANQGRILKDLIDGNTDKLQEEIEAEESEREKADDELTAKFNELARRLAFLSGDTVSWVTTDEYLVAFVDSEDNLLLGITKDAKLYISVGLPDGLIGLKEIIETIEKEREEADKALQDNIDAEATARKDADKTLQDNIDALEKAVEETYETKKEAEDAHDELQSKIELEEGAREKADDAITEKINELAKRLAFLCGDTVSWVTTDEYLVAFVDSEDNLLFGITKDAKLYISVGLPDGLVGLREVLEAAAKEREEAEKTLQDNIDALEKAVEETYETKKDAQDAYDKLQEEIDSLEQTGSATYETKDEAKESHDELQANIDKKQDILTAGFGIDITNNVVSSTIDTNPLIFVEELPTEGIEIGKIYCTPDPESTDEKNIWDEWYWIENEQRWEAVGKYIPTIDLTPYEKTEDAEKAHEELAESVAEESQAREEDVSNLTDQLNEIREQLAELSGDTVKWITNDSYLIALVDSEDNLLFAITKDAKVFIPIGLPDGIIGLATAIQNIVDVEAEARKEADTNLQMQLDAFADQMNETYETQLAAKAAHDELQSNIDALKQEAADTYETKTDADKAHEEILEALDVEVVEREGDFEQLASELATLKEDVEKLSGDTVKWVTTDEYLMALVDSEDSLLLGITKDVKLYIPTDLPDGIVGLRELLENYAEKTNYYTKKEIDDIVATIASGGVIDLSGYLPREEAAETYQLKGDYALKSDIPDVPTKTSQLTNDSGFITDSDLSGYETTEAANSQYQTLQNNISSVQTAVDNTYTKEQVNSMVESVQNDVDNCYTKEESNNTFQPKGEYAEETEVTSLAESLATLTEEVKEVTQSDKVTWVSNDEYLAALVDGEDNLLFGITKDAKTYIPVELPDGIVGLKEILEKYAPQSDTYTMSQVDDLIAAAASGGEIDLSGYLTKDEAEKTYAKTSDIPTLNGLGGVGSVSASGTSPLHLSASKSGTTVSITGSVDTVSSSNNGLMTATQSSTLDTLTAQSVISVGTSYSAPLSLSANITSNKLNISGSVSVNNTLTSTSTTTPLSAYQGNVLNGKISDTNTTVSKLSTRVSDLEDSAGCVRNSGVAIWLTNANTSGEVARSSIYPQNGTPLIGDLVVNISGNGSAAVLRITSLSSSATVTLQHMWGD